MTGMGGLVLLECAVNAFEAMLQGMVAEGVAPALPSPSPAAPAVSVATLLLLHLQFACGVEVDEDLTPIWEAVARLKVRT